MKLEPLLTNGNPFLREFAKKYVRKFPNLEVDWKKTWSQDDSHRKIEIIHSCGKILYDLKLEKVVGLNPRTNIFLREWDSKIYWEPEVDLEDLFLHILPEKGEEWAVAKRIIFGKKKKTKEELRKEIDIRHPFYPCHLPTDIALNPMGHGEGTGFMWCNRLILWGIPDITYDDGETNGNLLAEIMDDHREYWDGLEIIPASSNEGKYQRPKKSY